MQEPTDIGYILIFKRKKEIDGQIELARLLYNKLLEKAKDEYQKTKSFEINTFPSAASSDQ